MESEAHGKTAEEDRHCHLQAKERGPQKKRTLLTPWSSTSSPPNCEEVSFYCLSLPVYGIRHKDTDQPYTTEPGPVLKHFTTMNSFFLTHLWWSSYCHSPVLRGGNWGAERFSSNSKVLRMTKCPSQEERRRTLWSIHKTECYATVKMWLELYAVTGMNLSNIMLKKTKPRRLYTT